ncbi:hypothetical protein F5B19DRAFT_451638 [Rostrohypoxylon terebratum]|nr:hypothetical protein F5B19DRAFT_451638 [Rostrohypoxylon terebratum]
MRFDVSAILLAVYAGNVLSKQPLDQHHAKREGLLGRGVIFPSNITVQEAICAHPVPYGCHGGFCFQLCADATYCWMREHGRKRPGRNCAGDCGNNTCGCFSCATLNGTTHG